jgi:hypothetical protein
MTAANDARSPARVTTSHDPLTTVRALQHHFESQFQLKCTNSRASEASRVDRFRGFQAGERFLSRRAESDTLGCGNPRSEASARGGMSDYANLPPRQNPPRDRCSIDRGGWSCIRCRCCAVLTWPMQHANRRVCVANSETNGEIERHDGAIIFLRRVRSRAGVRQIDLRARRIPVHLLTMKYLSSGSFINRRSRLAQMLALSAPLLSARILRAGIDGLRDRSSFYAISGDCSGSICIRFFERWYSRARMSRCRSHPS